MSNLPLILLALATACLGCALVSLYSGDWQGALYRVVAALLGLVVYLHTSEAP